MRLLCLLPVIYSSIRGQAHEATRGFPFTRNIYLVAEAPGNDRERIHTVIPRSHIVVLHSLCVHDGYIPCRLWCKPAVESLYHGGARCRPQYCFTRTDSPIPPALLSSGWRDCGCKRWYSSARSGQGHDSAGYSAKVSGVSP